ncbi:MAG: trypsin-like serine protease [Methylococcales bacterium]
MDTTLIAKVFLTKKKSKRSIGTGYPISKNLVMTARHVVISPKRDFDKPIVIEWPDITDDSGKPYTVEVTSIVYDGGEQYDIVLLKCKIPPHIHISPLLLSQRFPLAHDPWEGFGYAEIGKNESLNTREKISVIGKFHPPDSASHKISLTSESDALEKAGWCGLSGTPAFQKSVLYAIIIETPTKREQCFTAVSIPYLLKHDSKFSQATGYDQLELEFNSAIAYLQGIPDAKSALFTQISKVEKKVADSPQIIVRYLVKMPIPDLIGIICDTQKTVQSQSIRKNLGELMRLLLPSLYGFDCVSTIRAGKADKSIHLIEIPYATDISAEMLMAATDNRLADFRVIELDYDKQVRPGKFRLAIPPETGPGAGEKQLQDIKDDLSNRLSRGDDVSTMQIAIDEHLFRINPRKQQRAYTPEDKNKLVSAWLEDGAAAGRPGFYWLLSLTDDESENQRIRKLAEHLKNSYPQITLLSLNMNTDSEITEYGLFNQLADTQSID